MDIGLSSLISSLANALFGTGAVVAQNQYNSPISQLRRLRKAGLPMSYMYQGRVNQQTQVPQLSLEPTLGQAKKLELSQQAEMNEANIKKIAEEILSIQEEVGLKKKEGTRRDIENERNQRKLNWEKDIDYDDRYNYRELPNDMRTRDLELAYLKSKEFIAKNEGQIRGIMAKVEDILFDEDVQLDERRAALKKVNQQITNLMEQAGLLKQMKDIRQFQADLNKAMEKGMDNKGDFAKILMWLIMQFTGKFSF